MVSIEVVQRTTLGVVVNTREDVVAVRQLNNLILDKCSVQTYVNSPVLLLEHVGIQRNLPTAVSDGTNVLVNGHVVVVAVRERTGRQRQTYCEEQVLVALVEVADAEVHATEQATLDGCVDSLSSLPLDILGAQALLQQGAVTTVLVDVVKSLVAIVAHAGIVTHLTIRGTYAQLVNPLYGAQELLFLCIPGSTE